MAHQAPALPTTEQLHLQYPLDLAAEVEIAMGRERVSQLILQQYRGVIGIAGPCAMTGDRAIIREEGQTLQDETAETQGLYLNHRLPAWKPRTNPADWHGLETSDPVAAFTTLVGEANAGGSLSMEIGQPYHMERYGHLLTLGWIGARNFDDVDFARAVALADPTLPLGIKNGMDGDVEAAVARVEELNRLRGPDAAPVFLIYRGGENAKTPETWEQQYLKALALTGGKMVVDVAHDTERAHDPDGTYLKSVVGQVAALMHVLVIAEDNPDNAPAGVMMEASRAKSPTDPVMPLQTAIRGVRRLHEIRTQGQRVRVVA